MPTLCPPCTTANRGLVLNSSLEVQSTPPASFSNLMSDLPYSEGKFFFQMALRLKDPEVFGHFCWSRFEIWNLKKLTICLYNYNGKHIFKMKYEGKNLFFSLIKRGYNIEVDSKVDDETTTLVFDGSMQVKYLGHLYFIW